ncbi:maintenance of telomere capping protein 2 [Monosporozyma unispora]|nr:Mtc2p [Kazachstania unispora]
MDSELVLPYKYGMSWALKERRNIIIVSFSDEIIENSKPIYNISEILANTANNSTFTIPNLIDWDGKDQKHLVHYINDHVNDNVMIIGIIPEMEDRSKIIDWLLHKFWICCGGGHESVETHSRSESIHISNSLIQYIKDLMIHLRIHRLLVQGNGGGIHTGTLKDVILLGKCISGELHDRKFVIPEDIKQALMWYGPWHMKVLTKEQWDQDTSLLYGSRPQCVQQYFDTVAGVRTGSVAKERLIIADVLKKVVPPI